MKPYCQKFNASVIGTAPNEKFVYRPRCKQWDCQYCAIQNMKHWRWRIANEIGQYSKNGIMSNSWFFWTLTLHGEDHNEFADYDKNASQSVQKWRAIWDTLLKRIRRAMAKYTEKFVYVRVFEMHKTGVLHVHMISNVAYHDIKPRTNKKNSAWNSETFKNVLVELGLGYIHDIKPIVTDKMSDNGIARNVSAYVTKYMTKDTQTPIRDILKSTGNGRIRLIQTSSKFFDEDPENKRDDIVWSIGLIHREDYHMDSQIESYYDISRDMEITDFDFDRYSHYPNQISDMLWLSELDGRDYNDGKDG